MAGASRAPPEDLNPQDLSHEINRVAYAAKRTSSAKLSFAFRKWPETVVPCREKAVVFTRLSMLIGPVPSRDTGRRFGGAAGNRTRVQSAYYTRVYLHSPCRSPDRINIGRNEGERKAPEDACVLRHACFAGCSG